MQKSQVLDLVADSGLPRRQALVQLGVPKSTYYRWLRRKGEGKLEDKKSGSAIPWNKLRPEEEERIVAHARAAAGLENS
jgi:transposase